jgi:hypothetical protein
VVTVAPRAMASDPIALREPVQAATAAPDNLTVVIARDSVESWDTRLRRQEARLNLAVSRPRLCGFAARQKVMWFAFGGAPGKIEVFRFSDGRLQLRADLGKRIAAVEGQVDSPRLIVAVREGEQPFELWELDLSLHDKTLLGADAQVAAFGVVEGGQPALVTADADGLLRWKDLTVPPAVAALPVDRPRVRHATPAIAIRTEDLEKRLLDPAATGSWRTKLASDSGRIGHTGPVPRAEPESPTPLPPRLEPAPLSGETAVASVGADEESWRTDLYLWGRSARTRPEAAVRPPDAPPIAEVARRHQLDDVAMSALALLYAAWLDGRPSVPAASVAQALAAPTGAPPTAAHWREALGRGALARAGLARAARGRLRLTSDAGLLIDRDGADAGD